MELHFRLQNFNPNDKLIYIIDLHTFLDGKAAYTQCTAAYAQCTAAYTQCTAAYAQCPAAYTYGTAAYMVKMRIELPQAS